MIVLIAIIAIILVKVNSSNVKNKEVKGIKPGTEAVKTKADTQTEDDSTTDKSGIEEFALFGVDSRSDQLDKGTRSDSIMVVRVDHDAKKIRMVSIFRDCMMNIDGHGYQKVTHAHAFGGPELAVDTLNKNLDSGQYYMRNFTYYNRPYSTDRLEASFEEKQLSFDWPEYSVTVPYWVGVYDENIKLEIMNGSLYFSRELISPVS